MNSRFVTLASLPARTAGGRDGSYDTRRSPRCSGCTKENARALLAGAHRSWHIAGGEQLAETVERGSPLRCGIPILATVEQVLEVDQERRQNAAVPSRFSNMGQ